MALEFPAYAEYIWWVKWYAPLVVCEDAVYPKDFVPDDYGGPQLSVEVVQRVVLITRQGYMWKQIYDDMSQVKDKDKKLGVGANLQAFGPIFPTERVDPLGPSSFKMDWLVRENPWCASRRDRLLALIQSMATLLRY